MSEETKPKLRPKKKHHKQKLTLREKPFPIDWSKLSDEKVDKLIELCERAEQILENESLAQRQVLI